MTFRLGIVFNSCVDIGHDLFEGLAGLGVDGFAGLGVDGPHGVDVLGHVSVGVGNDVLGRKRRFLLLDDVRLSETHKT